MERGAWRAMVHSVSKNWTQLKQLSMRLFHVMWDPGSLTRDQTHVPCITKWILNPWTSREVPQFLKTDKSSLYQNVLETADPESGRQINELYTNQ